MKISRNSEEISTVTSPQLLFDDVLRRKIIENSKNNGKSVDEDLENENFYGLSPQVKKIFEESRKISSLYGKIYKKNLLYKYI